MKIAGLTTMAAQETNPQIQRNMFSFISSLLQDVCDVGFAVGKGALALILVMMEESRLSWLDMTAVQEVRDKYCYRSVGFVGILTLALARTLPPM